MKTSNYPWSVVESVVWQRDDGRTRSIYGACPWTSERERARWKTISQGWTVQDARNGTVGCGWSPWQTREEAQGYADTWNADHAARAAKRAAFRAQEGGAS